METAAAIAIEKEGLKVSELIKELIISEVDLGYDKRQNVMLSCGNDGCNRIHHCSCDCNDGAC